MTLVTKILISSVTIALFMGIVLSMQVSNFASASAPSGLPARQTIATTTVVGPLETITIFESKASCSGRVISTTDLTGQAVQILFGDPTNGDIASTSIAESIGHLQSASTTQMYDSGLYGCGRWTAYAPASTTLLLSEFN